MEFRQGTEEDSYGIKAIDSAINSVLNRSEFIDSSLKQGTVLVALDDGEVVGYTVVNRSFFDRPTIEMLMVAESRRGRGVGRALLQRAQELVGTENELWTSTNESNSRMQALLVSEGFKQTGRIDNLDPGDPEIVYFKPVLENNL
ncbi:MAG: GNAT family N-acetyltransferase [Tissierellales bacterium]|nr:GNAT family N-acetyltransferase [Tissierellales bacterium]